MVLTFVAILNFDLIRRSGLNRKLLSGNKFGELWCDSAPVSAIAAEAISQLTRALPPIEYGKIDFVLNMSCLYPTYIRGQAYLAAGQEKEAAAEFQKIMDHSGIVWDCWTGALARLGVGRANVLQMKITQGADADAARTRALAAYRDFLTLWKDADPDIPIYQEAKAEYARLQ